MAKKENLENMVKERFDSLQPPIIKSDEKEKKSGNGNNQNKNSKIPKENHQEKELQVSPEQVVKRQEKPLSANCKIAEIIPSPEQQEIIDKQQGNENQIIIWDAFISQNGKKGQAFKKDSSLIFHVCCAASGLMEQLKPDFKMHWITQDINRLQIQPVYGFEIDTKPEWIAFEISCEMQPVLAGFFKFDVIVDISQTDLFWFKEGSIFKIQ